MKPYVPKGPARYEHQRKGLAKLIRNRGVGALLYDPGCGKTAAALDYVTVFSLVSPEPETRVLVISPIAAVDTWVEQSHKWVRDEINLWAEVPGGSIRQKVDIMASRGGKPFRRTTNEKGYPRALHVKRAINGLYRREGVASEQLPTGGPDSLPKGEKRVVLLSLNLDTFSSRQAIGSRTYADLVLAGVERFQPHIVIVDESHKIKGVNSNVSKLMARVADRVPRRIMLTGTVMPHSPLDVFAQWRFLDPTAFGKILPNGERTRATYEEFSNRFAKFGGFMGKSVVGFKNLDEMQKIMAQKAEVARKNEVLDLPKKTTVTIPVHLSKAEQAAYDATKKKMVAKFSDGTKMASGNRLSQLMRLRQITSGYLPVDTGEIAHLGKSKINVIRSLVQDTLAGEKRIVIFSVFIEEINSLIETLSVKGTEVLRIDGSVPQEERREIRKRFGSDAPERLIIVAQVATLSLAVNELVTASHAIFGSLPQKRDDFIQAQDRLDRIGQTRPTTMWFALAKGTVDEVIYKSHEERTDLEEAMLHHIQQEGEQ